MVKFEKRNQENDGRSWYHIVKHVVSCMCLSTNQAIELALTVGMSAVRLTRWNRYESLNLQPQS